MVGNNSEVTSHCYFCTFWKKAHYYSAQLPKFQNLYILQK